MKVNVSFTFFAQFFEVLYFYLKESPSGWRERHQALYDPEFLNLLFPYENTIPKIRSLSFAAKYAKCDQCGNPKVSQCQCLLKHFQLPWSWPVNTAWCFNRDRLKWGLDSFLFCLSVIVMLQAALQVFRIGLYFFFLAAKFLSSVM